MAPNSGSRVQLGRESARARAAGAAELKLRALSRISNHRSSRAPKHSQPGRQASTAAISPCGCSLYESSLPGGRAVDPAEVFAHRISRQVNEVATWYQGHFELENSSAWD